MFGMCMCLFCLCCPVFRYRPCDELITRPSNPTVRKMTMTLKNQRLGSKGAVEPVKKIWLMTSCIKTNFAAVI
jgi:hypothetical protein